MAKRLVAYFSATGTTERVAERLAKAANADLFEIKPAQPYTAADLNWNNPASRATVESKDEGARPAIADKVDGMDGYDVVFLGFPIWWYVEPRIIDTFLESYDLAGKTVVPFATSGGSGVDDATKRMQGIAPTAKFAQGRRLSAGTGEAQLRDWVDGLSL